MLERVALKHLANHTTARDKINMTQIPVLTSAIDRAIDADVKGGRLKCFSIEMY